MSNEIRDSIMDSLLGEQKHKGLYISGLTTLDREICSNMFNRCKADIIDMSNVDISYAVDMSHMFSMSWIQTIILPRMSAPRLKIVSHMFAGSHVGHIDMSGFDAPSIVDYAELNTVIDELRTKATQGCPYSYPSSEIAECLTGDYLSKENPY